MGSDKVVDCKRRRLVGATAAVGGVAGVFTLVPLVSSLMPSERAKAAGAPVEVDISKLGVGDMITVEWRGKPVWIINRSKEMLASLKKTDDLVTDPNSDKAMQPEYCKNEARSIKPEIFVAIGVCTHLGCSPTEKITPGAESGIAADWPGGFICACHGSTFDLAGRVFKNKPAPDNLEIPPHTYLSESKLLIGEDKKGA